jgi:cbb3-type cytochrome oxidase subunit 3
MIAGFVTAFLLAAFLGGAYWLFVVRRAADFDRMARIPLEESAEHITEEARP